MSASHAASASSVAGSAPAGTLDTAGSYARTLAPAATRSRQISEPASPRPRMATRTVRGGPGIDSPPAAGGAPRVRGLQPVPDGEEPEVQAAVYESPQPAAGEQGHDDRDQA